MRAVSMVQARQQQAQRAQRGRDGSSLHAVVRDARPPTPAEVSRVMTGLHMSYAALKSGAGTSEDVVGLGLMLNVGLVRARSIGPELVKAFDDAGCALQECEALQERHGRYGFTGPGLIAMNAALEFYEEVLAMSSLNQMDAAEREVVGLMRDLARAN